MYDDAGTGLACQCGANPWLCSEPLYSHGLSPVPPPARCAVQFELVDRTIALLGITLPFQGSIFFNHVSDEEFEETTEGEDTFQDAETTQFLPTSARNIPPIDPVTSML